MKARIIIKTILVILWLFIIFSFSAQKGEDSSSLSDGVLIKIAEFINGEKLSIEEKEIVIDKYSIYIRKLAHFSVYFILGILVFLLLKEFFFITPKTFIYTILFCLIYASTDEIHQMFVNNRVASIIDVLIDTFGSLLASTIIFVFYKLRKKHIIN